MAAHSLRGVRLAATSLLLAVSALPLQADAQAARYQWATYVGGDEIDSIYSLARDDSDNVVASGFTSSPELPSQRTDVSVSRFFSTGALRYKVAFGGEGHDLGYAVTVGPKGEVYVAGSTRSIAIPPSPPLAHITYGTYADGGDAFLAQVDTQGVLKWFMYLGGPGEDLAFGVTASADAVYVTGRTTSSTFPGVTGAALGKMDGFVLKVNPDTTPPTIVWGRFIGGSDEDELHGIAVQGDAVVGVGTTFSRDVNAPRRVQGAQGGSDALVVKLRASDGAVTWATHVGGGGHDVGRALVLEPTGRGMVVAGSSESGDFGERPLSSGKDAYAAWLNEEGVQQRVRVHAGSASDEATGVGMDASGNVYLAGQTTSGDFPLRYAFDETIESKAEVQEGFVLMFPAREGKGWSSFVGGSEVDGLNAISVTGNRLVVAGATLSATGMATPGAYDTTLGGSADGFLASLTADVTAPVGGTVSAQVQPEGTPEDSQPTVASVSINWSGFTDAETGIVGYEWAVGTEENPEALKSFTSTGDTVATVEGVSLAEGTRYIVSVRAHNGAGLATTATSTLTLPEKAEPGPALGWQCATTGQAPSWLLGLVVLMFRRRRA